MFTTPTRPPARSEPSNIEPRASGRNTKAAASEDGTRKGGRDAGPWAPGKGERHPAKKRQLLRVALDGAWPSVKGTAFEGGRGPVVKVVWGAAGGGDHDGSPDEGIRSTTCVLFTEASSGICRWDRDTRRMATQWGSGHPKTSSDLRRSIGIRDSQLSDSKY